MQTLAFVGVVVICISILYFPVNMPCSVTTVAKVGIAVGVAALLKIYFAGGRHYGNERIDGKTVIITGANTGIGKETAIDLAKRGGKIILACRDRTRAENAQKDIIDKTSNKNVHVRILNLSSFKSIREFAAQINKEEDRIDILINNAGVMMCPFSRTDDGFETQFGVNHLGHFLLTNLLLDKIKASAPARIITVSSTGHWLFGEMKFDDLNRENNYDKTAAYGQSKLCNILFTRELARKLKGTNVTANSLHPGGVDTELPRHISIANHPIVRVLLYPIILIFFKTSEEGAQTSIHLALDSSLNNVTGKYFSDCVVTTESKNAQNDEDARKLWLVSEKLTKLV